MPRRRKPPRAGAIGELPPLRILSQIAAIQGIYYATALILFLFTGLVAGTGFHMDLVFGWASLRGDTTQGFVYAFVWLCCSAVGGGISRARGALETRPRLCVYDALPAPLRCHLLHRLPAAQLHVVGDEPVLHRRHDRDGHVGCQWRELRPINFGGNGGRTTGAAGTEGNGHAGGNPDGGGMGDEEMGFGRGRGRGRGRDGAGEYELASIREQEGN
ncbi:Protein SYS1 [Apiospora hydei]|uniref:Protein SYS1 n=1 Tax=Apiospora hydei TaxID=1337664 RepID=A0ABR1WZ42_9PEZI